MKRSRPLGSGIREFRKGAGGADDPQEVVVIVLLLLIVFGPGKAVSMARDLGRFVTEARGHVEEFKGELLYCHSLHTVSLSVVCRSNSARKSGKLSKMIDQFFATEAPSWVEGLLTLIVWIEAFQHRFQVVLVYRFV